MNFKHLLVTSVTAVALCASAAPAAAADQPSVLADLRNSSGARALFLHDPGTGVQTLVQEGPVDRGAPVDTSAGLLAAYLALTPAGTPVPAALARGTAPAGRVLSRSTVRSTNLITPAGRAGPTCATPYYSWRNWRDEAMVNLAPATYQTSDFAGKKRYVESFIINCTTKTEPETRTARHRILERQTEGGQWSQKYVGTAKPKHWQSYWRGSTIRKHYAVAYDDSWLSTGGCAVCTYAREGRFTDTRP